jgi:hypothetical protein
MRIAVCIPSYAGHLPFLEEVLDAYGSQTRLPDLVSISISSIEDPSQLAPLQAKSYPFPVQWQIHTAQKCSSQNRNCCMETIPADIDVISFFDSDDLPHPQRLEWIERGFEAGAEVVLHSYRTLESRAERESHPLLSVPVVFPEGVLYGEYIPSRKLGGARRFVPSCKFMDGEEELCVTFGNCSIARSVFEAYRFDEEADRVEDKVFISTLVRDDKRIAVLRAELTLYCPVWWTG